MTRSNEVIDKRMTRQQPEKATRSAGFEEMDFLYPKIDARVDDVQQSMLEMALAEDNRAAD